MPPPVAVPQNAVIDIMESLTIGSGQRQDVTFRYLTGIPAATAFGMEWYANEVDPALNRPPLTTRDMPIPTQTFSPAEPQPNTGDFQDGTVTIQAPDIGDDADGLERFYGNNFYLPSLRRIHMTWVNQTAFLFICLLLLCCLSCGDPPPSVMELVMPDSSEATEPPDATIATEVDTSERTPEVTTPLFEIEAILATRGEVHSPIPDDVYDLLWGHWTEAGLSAPRHYYTKYINAGGIAIVGGDLVDDGLFQAARHVVLVMTSKVPGLREALSITTPGVDNPNARFRLALLQGYEEIASDLPDVSNAPSGSIFFYPLAAAQIVRLQTEYGGVTRKGPLVRTVIHEMAHAIHHTLISHPHLFPDFGERLGDAWFHEGELFGQKDAWEFWAEFINNDWLDEWNTPHYLNEDPNHQWRRQRHPNIVALAEEVFPAFPLAPVIYKMDYSH